MGIIIEHNHIHDLSEFSSSLIIYSQSLKSQIASRSISKELAESLLSCNPNRRSMKLEQLFSKILNEYPEGVAIDDIDVMFNPEYQVDVLKILIEARKRKKYSVIWPGCFKDGKLIYAEEGYPDYKVYEITNYDITCVR